MRIVELDDELLVEVIEILSRCSCRRIMSCSEQETKKVLLLEPQYSWPASCFIVRIQHLGDRLRRDLCIDRLEVVAGVEGCEVELLRRLGAPQPEPVGRVHAIAKDRHVPGGTAHEFSGEPTGRAGDDCR
jgi:hypothetical protein